MNSFRMKALSLAVLSLAGLGMAGSAFAVCPTADTTKGVLHSPGGGGAWTSQFISADAALSIVSPGLNGTGCKLGVAVGAASNTRVFVEDDSPSNEQRYRARFYVGLANLPNFGNATNKTGIVFRVNDATGPAQFGSDEIVVRLVGGLNGGAPTVRFFLADANAVSGFRQVIGAVPASATNTWRIEFDLQHGAAAASTTDGCQTMPASGGCFRYWISDADAASGSDSTPDHSTTINNAGWSGADKAFLGLTTATNAFRQGNAGAIIFLDEFDSRRQTFIGK